MMMMNKQQFLIPISCIIKLIMLGFKPEGTKLSFRNFSVQYDDPSEVNFLFQQTIDRKIRGDSREDISILNNTIVKYVEWYIIGVDKNAKEYKVYKKLLEYSICGFRKLQATYIKNSEYHTCVVLTLQYYINLLEDIVANTDLYDLEYLYRKVPCMKGVKSNNKIIDIEKVKNLWKFEDLEIVNIEIEHCMRSDKNNSVLSRQIIDTKIKGVFEILQTKDEEFFEIVKSFLSNAN